MSAITWLSLIYLPITYCLNDPNYPLVPVFPIFNCAISIGLKWWLYRSSYYVCILSKQCTKTNEYSHWAGRPGEPELPKVRWHPFATRLLSDMALSWGKINKKISKETVREIKLKYQFSYILSYLNISANRRVTFFCPCTSLLFCAYYNKRFYVICFYNVFLLFYAFFWVKK